MSSARAKQFAIVLQNAADDPVDVGDQIDMKLPDYADEGRLRRAQEVFRNNFFSTFYAMYCGLIAILAIPSILNVLVHSNKSSTDMTAYKRYMQTIYHTLTWFRHDLKPGTKAWKSLEAVRKFHFSASRSAKNAKVGMISQKDMVITQYGFIGFTIVSRKETGMQGSEQDLADYCHLWRVLGHVLGIKDELNLCCETFEETLERMEVIRDEFLRPALQFPPKDFQPMTRCIANGLWCFNPRDNYNVIIFMIKRMIGVPNFYYHEEEIPKDFDRSNLEVFKLGYYERFEAWAVTFIHEYLLQFSFIRWFFNMDTLFHEFLITYFPFLAFYKFGYKNAYVTILDKGDAKLIQHEAKF